MHVSILLKSTCLMVINVAKKHKSYELIRLRKTKQNHECWDFSTHKELCYELVFFQSVDGHKSASPLPTSWPPFLNWSVAVPRRGSLYDSQTRAIPSHPVLFTNSRIIYRKKHELELTASLIPSWRTTVMVHWSHQHIWWCKLTKELAILKTICQLVQPMLSYSIFV